MRAKKKDLNQGDLEKQLRDLGFSVQSLHTVGQGVPDLLVGVYGFNFLLEVKHDNAALTQAEIDWHKQWSGQVRIVQSVEEILLYASSYADGMKRKLGSVVDHCDLALAKLRTTKGDEDEPAERQQLPGNP